MTHAFKLPKHLIPGKGWLVIASTSMVLACANDLAEQSPSTLTSVVLSPESVTVAPNHVQVFVARGRLSDSSTAPLGVTWSATGGAVDASGTYVAGTIPGKFRIIAQAAGSELADTAEIIVPAPTVQSIRLSPRNVSLLPGALQQYAATGVLSDSSTASVSVTYTATGGSISTSGLYTAGPAAGNYRVVATQTGGTLADTATLTVTTPPSSSCVGSSTHFCPGDSLQLKVNAAAPGTPFTFGAGVYRNQTITPKLGQVFTGMSGAVMSGAKLLTGWTGGGGRWSLGGQTAQGQAIGVCQAASPGCALPEEMFRDNRRLVRVTSLGAVGPGSWYFDYATDVVTIGDDPTGHTMELSVTPTAFVGSNGTAHNVTIQNLVIEKYASPGQWGAIFGWNVSGWRILNDTLRLNHGAGVMAWKEWLIQGSVLRQNGQLGAKGQRAGTFPYGLPPTGLTLKNNVIDSNNAAHYDYNWEAGGLKILHGDSMLIRGNTVRGNEGPGIWLDFTQSANVIDSNTVTGNVNVGIYHEISKGAIIRGNVTTGNALTKDTHFGGGIVSDNGTDLEVVGNTVSENRAGIIVRHVTRTDVSDPALIVQNYNIHDNTVSMTTGFTGIVQYTGDTGIWSRNNRFTGNRYTLGSNTRYFMWRDGDRTDTEWRGYGEDTNGSFQR